MKIGSKVTHTILPGVFIIKSDPAPNEIGEVLIRVEDERGEICYLHPENLRLTGVAAESKSAIQTKTRRKSKRDQEIPDGTLFQKER